MNKEFEVSRVTRAGRFYVMIVTERGVRSAATRELLVHRNNMPKSDPVGTVLFTKFTGRVPIRRGFDDAGHAHIVGGSFEENGGVVTGTLSIEIADFATEHRPHLALLETT